MRKYWCRGLAAAALALGAHGAWAQSVTGCPAGQAMQSSDPSGKAITCVPIPDTAALQQQINNEATTRQQADNALSARIDALEGVGAVTEADIVGKWAVSGTTDCIQSSTNFSANMSPIIPATGSAFVSRLGGTFIGTRIFNSDRTGRSVGTTHAMSFPGTFHGVQPNTNPPVFFAGVGTGAGGASVATLDAGFTWEIKDGMLHIDDGNLIVQPFTAPPSRLGFTAEIENHPGYVGHISKDRKTIVMTHPVMQVEISTVKDPNGNVLPTNPPTPRFCARHRVLTRLAD
jgi:hypothetical protein